MPGSRHSIYLHIGPAKTGTTYLQDVLWRNRDRLVAADVTFPGSSRIDHFHAAIDLRGIAFGGYATPDAVGAWPRLVRLASRAGTSRVVVSHELFAGADEAQIARVATDLAGFEQHVVYGVRDLARQLPAVWQESLKNRRTRTYDRFLRRMLSEDQPVAGSDRPAFWRSHDPVLTLHRWSTAVPPERIHVVTLPPAGAPADTLWRRFCRVLDISPGGFDLDVARSNASLTLVDTEVLRRLNAKLPSDLTWPAYERAVKSRFNRRADNRRPGERLRVPLEHRDRVLASAERTRSGLLAAGYDIVGDLADLVPAEEGFGQVAEVAPEVVTDAAVDMLAATLMEARGWRKRVSREAARTILGHLRRARGTS